MKLINKKRLSNVFWGISFLAFILGLYLLYKHIDFKYETEKKIKGEIEKKINTELDKVNKKLTNIKKVAISIIEKLGEKNLNTGEIEKLLQENLKKHENLVGIGAAFEPFVLNKKTKLFAPYYQKEKDKIVATPINYDYTKQSKGKLKHDINWYIKPLSSGESWANPYYDSKRNIVVGEYAIAFYKNKEKKKPLGIIFVEFNLNDIKEGISYLNLGKRGYGFLLSSDGIFISYPIEEYVKGQKSIFDLEREGKKKSLVDLCKRMLNGEKGIVDYTDYINEDIQKQSWAFLHQIKTTNWYFAAIYFKTEVFGKYLSFFKKNKILITLAVLFFLLFFFLGFIFRYPFNKKFLIWYSVLTSLLLVGGIGFIWKFSFEEGFYGEENKVIITSQTDVLRFFNSKEGQTNIEQPIYIPTGIIVNHLEFLDVNNIHVSGYLWQKYSKKIKDKEIPKIFFEKALNSKVEIKKIYLQDNKKIVEMDFNCTIPVINQYHKYPFDHQIISLNIISTDRISDKILIPDFQAYSIITPSALPGVSKKISLKGWNFKKSFFAYATQFSGVTYGLTEKSRKNKPLFSFNIVIKRLITQPFLSIILPIIIILFLIFMLLLSVNKFNTLTLFSVISALILGIIFSHVSLRDKLPISGFFYLEYFYLVSYFIIVLVALNVFFLFKVKEQFKFLHYKNNLIAKLLYWPVTLFIIYLLTVYVFYY